MAVPVLIYADNSKIAEEKAFLAKVVAYIQDIYDEFKTMNIEITVSQLVEIGVFASNWTIDGKRQQINTFISNYLMELAGEPDFNGVKISRSKLKDLLEMPDIAQLLSIIEGYVVLRRDGFGIKAALLSLTDDVVTKSANADNLIETEFTYYSKTEFGHQLTAQLFTLSTALNNYNTYAKANIGSALNSNDASASAGISGIEYFNGVFRPNLYFIRQKEELKSN